MKLTRKQQAKVEAKTGSEAIDRNSTSEKKLVKVFGPHTFFKHDKGVFIVEPTTDPERESRSLVKRVRLAVWANSEQTSLVALKTKKTIAL